MTFKNNLIKYKIVFYSTAKKELNKLEKKLAKKVEQKLYSLLKGNVDLNIKKLLGYKEPTYRLRIGDIRVVYSIWNDKLIVYIIKIGHRKDIYKKIKK